tara:strand:+ start:505 stop:1575 length:1071 start_codon:yes stop_codon:yes gene_type:complete
LDKQLRTCLIGCGKISERHSYILGNGHVKNAKLTAVCDLNEKNAEILSKRYSIPFYTDMHKMLTEEKIDLIVVLTESGYHCKHVLEIAKYSKSIIVEKPISLTIEDGLKMRNECEKFNSRLFVVKQNRYNIPVIKLKEAIDIGRFKKLFLGTVRVRWSRDEKYYRQQKWRGKWSMDGGVLSNQAIHHIDMLQWMMGDVKSVFAYGIQASAEIEAEDTATVNLKFKNGAIGIIEATTATRPRDLEGSISILGTGGTVVIEGFSVNKMKTWQFCEEIEQDKLVFQNYSENPSHINGYGHIQFYNSVVDSILNNKNHPLNADEAIKSLKLLCAIYESIESGKEVKLDKSKFNTKLGLNK